MRPRPGFRAGSSPRWRNWWRARLWSGRLEVRVLLGERGNGFGRFVALEYRAQAGRPVHPDNLTKRAGLPCHRCRWGGGPVQLDVLVHRRGSYPHPARFDPGVQYMSDARAALARREHEASLASEADARHHRALRDQLVRKLHSEGWTQAALARAIGCSPELTAHIVRSKP